mgnify:FL=1
MKLTKQKLKEIIKEELLKEYMDLSNPIKEARKLMDDFSDDLDYWKGGSTEGDSIEYENKPSLYRKRYESLTKWQKTFDKVIKKALNDYKKAWKVK